MSPERLARLRYIARSVAWRVWRSGVGGSRLRFHHGLLLDDLESAAMEAILRVLPRHDERGGDKLLFIRARGGVLDALREADPLGRSERERRWDADEPVATTDLVHRPDRVIPEQLDALRRVDEQMDAAGTVGEAFPLLSAADRDLLQRLYRDEVSQDQVASERGVSPTAISQAHTKALRRFQRILIRLASKRPPT